MRSVPSGRLLERAKAESGFSLVEMAIVMLVLGVLMRAAIQPMGARLEASQRNAAKTQLQQVKAAITGYLILNGRLPCPASDGGRDTNEPSSVDGQVSGKPCSTDDGGVDASMLALSGQIDEAGLLLDPWGTALRYKIANPFAYSNPDATRQAEGGLSQGSTVFRAGSDDGVDWLLLCRSDETRGCDRRQVLADQLEFVVLSLGRDSSRAGAQGRNQDDDHIFVLQPESVAEGHEFDDELVWMGRSEVAYWLLRSGRVLF